MARLLATMYERLLKHHGPQGWWPGEGPFETIVGAILTQNTAWTNAARAIANLRAADAMSPSALRAMPEADLAEVVRPSGYFNAKARKLKAIADFLGEYGDSVEAWRRMEPKALRAELLRVHGVGPETADDIVLYAAGLPSFVMDVYTQRIVDRMLPRHGLRGYDAYQALFERHLPHEAALFNEYHALLDAHAKDVCTKREPRCASCVLSDLCATGRRATK
ncbi:MAG: endonuclease [Chloroflexi bacterium]|nr:endonuclease [Chloroflexota bacterium]